jgi:hypothetical protein
MKTTQNQTRGQNKRPPAKVGTAPPLAAYEWSFDDLPDAEVEICCYWEYARESQFIRSFRERCAQPGNSIIDLESFKKAVDADFEKLAAGLGRKALLFQEGIYGLGGKTWYKEEISPFPKPWQALSPEMRRLLLETAGWIADKFSAFRWSVPVWALALAQRYAAPRQPTIESSIQETPSKISQKCFVWPQDPKQCEKNEEYFGDEERAEKPSLKWITGVETLMVEIEWGRFTNKEIINSFIRWVKVHRPKNVKGPSRRGIKDTRWIVALQRLGTMRALNAHKLADNEFPERVKGRAGKNCNWERQKALENFREFFPFLPESAKPIHWGTKAGRAK